MSYDYLYSPNASITENVSRSMTMDAQRARFAPTATQLRARAAAPTNGHATPIPEDPSLRQIWPSG